VPGGYFLDDSDITHLNVHRLLLGIFRISLHVLATPEIGGWRMGIRLGIINADIERCCFFEIARLSDSVQRLERKHILRPDPWKFQLRPANLRDF